MIAISIILSFLLEGIVSSLVNINGIFIPLFTIISLVILYPYFNNKKTNYIFVCAIVGVFYDIVYTNSLFVNSLAFVLNGIFIILFYNYINNNWFNAIIISLISIIVNRFITYFLLCIMSYLIFNENILIQGIYSSIIINIIYALILYFVCYIVSKKLGIKKID